jgi:hypothetical protein
VEDEFMNNRLSNINSILFHNPSVDLNNELSDNLKYMHSTKLQTVHVYCRGCFTSWTAEQDVGKMVKVNSAMLHSSLEQEAEKNALIMDTGQRGTQRKMLSLRLDFGQSISKHLCKNSHGIFNGWQNSDS